MNNIECSMSQWGAMFSSLWSSSVFHTTATHTGNTHTIAEGSGEAGINAFDDHLVFQNINLPLKFVTTELNS